MLYSYTHKDIQANDKLVLFQNILLNWQGTNVNNIIGTELDKANAFLIHLRTKGIVLTKKSNKTFNILFNLECLIRMFFY